MSSIAQHLREAFPRDKLHLLIAKRNKGSFTYDGIELGGERVCAEIEEELRLVQEKGGHIDRLSIVGYSLGGLVARYAIGLLFSRGVLDKLEPVVRTAQPASQLRTYYHKKGVRGSAEASSIMECLLRALCCDATSANPALQALSNKRIQQNQKLTSNFDVPNFTTFATPHLGVRSPGRGYHHYVWNVLGASTLSESGRQLFTVDRFRDTGRPLLAVMADPGSIFISGLRKFKRRTLYANVINDRTAVHYTTYITQTDPFVEMNKKNLRLNYIPGYENVIVDAEDPVAGPAAKPGSTLDMLNSLGEKAYAMVRKIPRALGMVMFIPLGIIAFLVNSGIQTFQSGRRIRLHQQGLAGIDAEHYRVPLWIRDMREAVEESYEHLTADHGDEFLQPGDADYALEAMLPGTSGTTDYSGPSHIPRSSPSLQELGIRVPTLALTPEQFEMIHQLNEVGWRKYPVHIQKDPHSHAVIITRFPKSSFTEGKVVMRHWLKEEFLI